MCIRDRDIGDYVNAGKLLAVIDKSLYSQNVKQSEGFYRVAEASVENDKINLERTKILFEKGLFIYVIPNSLITYFIDYNFCV